MKRLLFMAALTGFVAFAAAQQPAGTSLLTLKSPDGRLTLSLQNDGGNPNYRIEHAGAVVVKPSPLGLRLADLDLSTGLTFKSASPAKAVEEKYEVIHGKRRSCLNTANESTVVFQKNDAAMEIDFRVFNNGVAFRYRLPGKSTTPRTLAAELTGFAVPEEAKVWAAPSDKPTMYAPAYETYYEAGVAAGTPAPLGFGWSFPLLYHAGSKWALLTEANVQPNFCGSRLANNPAGGVYRLAFPDPKEGLGHGEAKPSSTLPWEMPWRVVMVGDSLGTIVESTLVTDLAAPSRVKDTSWIKPGRVAWSWWGDPPSPQDGAKQKKFVDLAAEMGWEYMLVDANWDIMDNGNVHDVLRHAKKKGVGVLLWYNSGGPHNIVTEKPRDTLTAKPVRRFELDMLRKWGVKGIKVDFFQSDKQEIIDLYHGILQDAADHHIMVNFHGCTLPRGWERTWPHLMSMEAVRGEECYIFDDKYPERAPVQNTILPFTRNAVGPMDYTPVTFSQNTNPRRTTAAHELALSVVFETGWLHMADRAEPYLSLPDAPKNFLKHVPVTWDDTRFVAGEPGDSVIIARRKGDTWYIGGINGTAQARKLAVHPGAWLTPGKYDLLRISDGKDGKTFSDAKASFNAGEEFSVNVLPYGGFVATLKQK